MPERSTEPTPAHTEGRPFPWYCPNCRRREVRRVTIPYQCQRQGDGRPITVMLPALEVPRCGHCGELVFTYDTEEQINRAYQAQIEARRNGAGRANRDGTEAGERKAGS